MKRIIQISILTLLIFGLIAPAEAATSANPYYPVPKVGKTSAGIYQKGKPIVLAKNKNETLPIRDVVTVKSSIFYTEVAKSTPLNQCNKSLSEYSLKLKSGKYVKIFKDRISSLSSPLSTDGTFLYYPAMTGQYTNDFIRLSADGKSRQVLVKEVDDAWYAAGSLFYVKNGSIHILNPKTLQSSLWSASMGSSYSGGPCSENTYTLSPNGIMMQRYTFDNHQPSHKTSFMYDYKKKTTSTLDPVRIKDQEFSLMYDFDVIKKQYVNMEFDSKGPKLVLRDFNHKKVKDIHRIYAFTDLEKSHTVSKYYEELNLVKRKITYVSGSQLVVKKF